MKFLSHLFASLHILESSAFQQNMLVPRRTYWQEICEALEDPIAVFSFMNKKYAPSDRTIFFVESYGEPQKSSSQIECDQIFDTCRIPYGFNDEYKPVQQRVVLRGSTSLLFNSIEYNFSYSTFEHLIPQGTLEDFQSYRPYTAIIAFGIMSTLELLPYIVVLHNAIVDLNYTRDFPMFTKNSESVMTLRFMPCDISSNFVLRAIDAFINNSFD